ncbi:MAG: hypothetical protein LBD29_03550 [Treponema sp.]|jgi:hypothetical protein|nr:hypothetical protein [Treponema sp.]
MPRETLTVSRHGTFPLYVCASESLKLIGTIDGRFPDFGHHVEKEMGGLWLHPIKLLDGFWLRFQDLDADQVDLWTIADEFQNHPEGNVFRYHANLGHTPIRITRSQIAPEPDSPDAAGMVVEYAFFNTASLPRRLKLDFFVRTDLRPVWFSEEQGIHDDDDEGIWLPEEQVFLAKDRSHPWYAAAGSIPAPDTVETGAAAGQGPENTAGRGTSVRFQYAFTVAGGETKRLRCILAGSGTSRAACLEAYRTLTVQRDFWAEKALRYQRLLEKSRLEIEDLHFQTCYDWVKVNTDWLILDAGVYGRGLSAGLPEYPWWFGCDSTYSLQGVLAMGDYQLCRDTLNLLRGYSEQVNGNGRVVHEVTTAGFCFNPGNTQETAHFITMIWDYYEWTGDRELADQSFPFLEKAAAWLRSQDPEGDGFPRGYGIIEIPGLDSKMLDTAVYAAQSYGSFSKLCALKGLEEAAAEYAALERRCIERINQVFWDPGEGLYCDTYTSGADVDLRRDAILGRLYGPGAEMGRQALREALDKKSALDPQTLSGWLLNYAWIINTPMETGAAPRDKADRALAILHSPRFIGPYGMYLSGLFRDQSMTISTGVMAVAQARYGYADRSLELLEKMFSAFSAGSPGCISEMLPDYGCFVQAWTIYAVMTPIVRYFFGLNPSASRQEVRIAPNMPRKWAKGGLKQVRVLDGEASVTYYRDNGREYYRIEYSGTGTICFEVPSGRTGIAGGKTYQSGDLVKSDRTLEIQIFL